MRNDGSVRALAELEIMEMGKKRLVLIFVVYAGNECDRAFESGHDFSHKKLFMSKL